MPESATNLLPAPTDKPLDAVGGVQVYDIGDLPTRLLAMFYGTTGAGKTYLAAKVAEVPEMLPALFINIGGGPETIKTHFPESKIRVVTPAGKSGAEQWASINTMYDDLNLKGGGGYKTIVIDLLSEAYNLCMEWWLAHEKTIDTKRDEDLPGASGGKDDYGRDWNKVRSVIRKMVRGYSGLGTHLIFTAHDKEDESRTSKIVTNNPAFPGQATKDILGFINEVYYVYTADSKERDPETKLPKVEHRIQCQPTNVRPMCKSRGGLPMVLVEPSVSDIMRYAGIKL